MKIEKIDLMNILLMLVFIGFIIIAFVIFTRPCAEEYNPIELAEEAGYLCTPMYANTPLKEDINWTYVVNRMETQT